MNVEGQSRNRHRISRRHVLQVTGASMAAATVVAGPAAPGSRRTRGSWLRYLSSRWRFSPAHRRNGPRRERFYSHAVLHQNMEHAKWKSPASPT
jgi:hypothetical protein